MILKLNSFSYTGLVNFWQLATGTFYRCIRLSYHLLTRLPTLGNFGNRVLGIKFYFFVVSVSLPIMTGLKKGMRQNV